MDDDVIRIAEHYYIRANSTRAEQRTLTLKQGDSFAVFDRFGDCAAYGLGEQGLFHDGTRFLSHLELRIDGNPPLLLSSTVTEEDLLTVDVTNGDITATIDDPAQVVLPRGILHVLRTKFLWEGVCYERLQLVNYGMVPVSATLAISFDADFRDIFEVRGARRARRGRRLDDGEPGAAARVLAYQGLDGVVRRTHVHLAPTPVSLEARQASWRVSLAPQESSTIDVRVACEVVGSAALGTLLSYETALAAKRAHVHPPALVVRTDNERFNRWLARSASDLRVMITETPHGLYPYAGVPWFSTVFGRDGIFTAFQLLLTAPEVAAGVLAQLAALQADEVDPARDAEPGKILHEMRRGEMAALGEIPFGRYYGSVDATPLFVMLAGAHYQRTGDRALAAKMWPHVQRALGWIEHYGDVDGDGFVEYVRKSETGLSQQGWKDSADSVFHADGAMAEPPIALCEVQGYVYGARLAAASLARALGHEDRAEAELQRARVLRRRFEEAFFCEEIGTYALALDGQKRPCRVRSSNPGHCLWAGIASPETARLVAQALLDDTSFSGFGIRTLATTEVRYNPMSYHNGSIWPHDTGLAALGFRRYGLRDETLRPLQGLFDATSFIELSRMPELFCGFPRRHGQGPTRYPVACSPQAWAAGTVFMLLEACLGLTIDGLTNEIRLHDPVLPDWLNRVRIDGLAVPNGSVDLLIERHPHDVGATILRRDGDVKVTVLM